MRTVAEFDPSTETNDTFNAGFANGSGRIVVFNESNVNLKLSWGSNTAYCPAWTAMMYCIATNNVNINWVIQSQLVSNQAPISQVVVEAYDNSEPLLGTFPAPLVRQTNMGNAINVATSATSINNDGNVAPTQVIEATVAGDSYHGVTLTNNGRLELGSPTHPGVLEMISGTDTVLIQPTIIQLLDSSSNVICQIDSNGLVLSTGKIGVVLAGDVIDASSPNALYLKCRASGFIAFQDPNGSNIMIIDQNGNMKIKGTLTQNASL